MNLADYWPHILATLHVTTATFVSIHVILHKDNERAAVAWLGLAWLSPVVGALLYWLLGINRIRRRARTLQIEPWESSTAPALALAGPDDIDAAVCPDADHLRPQIHLVGHLTRRPLLRGNGIRPLVDGDEAYPRMVEAIDRSTKSIALSTYIFDNDRAGALFTDALGRATARGVETRVLIDDVGARYSWPSIVRTLRRRGVRVARFIPSLIPWEFPYANLRNHRKILVVDGTRGFTGGMNIREGHLVRALPRFPVRDVHFEIEGPVIAHLRESFAEDWKFATGESLSGEHWFPPLELAGKTLARGLADGPDEDFDNIRQTILGALSAARSSVHILTPYFLPDESIVSTLGIAARRGVRVVIVVPSENNLRLVEWAMLALLPRLVASGCEVWLSAPPFDHSKLLVIDDAWAFFGSANWDARSLEMNFEFNVESYDARLATALREVVDDRRRGAVAATTEHFGSMSLAVRLRNRAARLLSPYL